MAIDMADIYKRFGEQVKKIRKEKSMTQERLAELIDRDPRTIVAIEAGDRNPTLNTIYKIAQALKITLTELFKF